MDSQQLKKVVEAALLAAGRPLSLDELRDVFRVHGTVPEKTELRDAITQLQTDFEDRAIEITEVASGFRVQVRSSLSQWLTKLWEERPARYSRALMETLSIIAYKQPVTRGEIEDVRGVAVSTNIIRTLLDRGWVREVGHRDVPGRPAMFGTTREFLDYFGLKKLNELPELSALTDIESLKVQLELSDGSEDESGDEQDSAPGREFDQTPDADLVEEVEAAELPMAANVVPIKAH
ncbi:MAG: SMC-Scp complex subunit ScpB [Gammaproteobacteria bacterium]